LTELTPLSESTPSIEPTEPPPAPPPQQPAPTTLRRFEFVEGGSKKFWEIGQTGCDMTVRYGRIGTNGQTQTKTFPEETRTAREVQKLIAEKVKKGYTEV
jgi:predicted DNA-binding WGR domain protein